MWGNPIYNQARNLFVIFLDCEGFASLEQSEDHDAKVFCLSVLISSLVIFNSWNTIDKKSIDSLALASELAHKVLSQDQQMTFNKNSAPSHFSPVFAWLIRDFHLELVMNG